MNRSLIIIHGWSDNSRSFVQLAKSLQKRLKRPVRLVNLADYITMDDDVMFSDIAFAMERAWIANKLPTIPYSVDLVVHSMGALVVRTWLQQYYLGKESPIKHLVMLAPANFGSHLAHKGRAFYGRVVKGFKSNKMFQVGTHLLKGLELGSSYTWKLAMRDRFSNTHFGVDKTLCTVLIGNSGYRGISAAANEVGSDGTVRMACANMNCALLEADFNQDPLHPTYDLRTSAGLTAFGILDNTNHSTITLQGSKQDATALDYIVKSLQLEDDEWKDWCY